MKTILTLSLTLKVTTAQVVKTSVTNNSLSKDYLHPDEHAIKDNQLIIIQIQIRLSIVRILFITSSPDSAHVLLSSLHVLCRVTHDVVY